MGNTSLFNVLELEGLNGRDHPSPTRLLQDSSQSSSGDCGSDCSSLANTVQTNSNLNSFKQNDASRIYPSPDLEEFAYESCAPGSDRDWIIDLVNSIGQTSNSSSAKYRPTGSFDDSPSAHDATSSTLSPLPTRNVSPSPAASSHIFISRNFTPSSFDEHLSDIDSDAMTFLNPYRTPEYCPEDVLEKDPCQDITSEPYHPGNFSGDKPCYLDGPDVALSSNDEYFVGHLARGDHRVTSNDDYVSASHTKDNHIQTPLYDYVVSTPDNGITSLPSIHHLATAAAYHGHVQHNLSAQPLFMSKYRSGNSLAMEFETTFSVNAPLDSSVFEDHAFHVQTPGNDLMDDDDEFFYLDDFSGNSSPGYLPVDINTLNPDLDPNEDHWTTNSIEYDYECSHSS